MRIFYCIFLFAFSSCITVNHIDHACNKIEKPFFVLSGLDDHNYGSSSLSMVIIDRQNDHTLILNLDSVSNENLVISGFEKAKNDEILFYSSFQIPLINVKAFKAIGNDGSFNLSYSEYGKGDTISNTITSIDSNRANSPSKIYSGLCRDKNRKEYYISAVTDPIPLILVFAIASSIIYEKEQCKVSRRKYEPECFRQNKKAYFTHFWQGCEFIGCK